MPATKNLLIGCVADDFTGATDVANVFTSAGMKTAVTIGVPVGELDAEVEAVVIALKSRTSPVADAVANSVAALRWLKNRGTDRYYFKYCSTFDSTDIGNIGPVTDAFADELGAEFVPVCPAFPRNGRTIYKSNLFVGDVPLNESGMRNHPLTPMTDSNLVRVISPQTTRKATGCFHDTVKKGPGAINGWIRAKAEEGYSIGVFDALDDDDLESIASAFWEQPLLTGASGLAVGISRAMANRGVRFAGNGGRLETREGSRAVISGSCSVATNEQVRIMLEGHEAYHVDVSALSSGKDVVGEAVDWASDRLGSKPVLIYATATPDEVKANQRKFGVEAAGTLVENALASISVALVDKGVSELVVAGGETSGAVVKALGVKSLVIGPEIAPGVPWVSVDRKGAPLALALKSGNFGAPDFFLTAWDKLR